MNKKRHSLRTCLYNILDLYNTLRFDLYNCSCGQSIKKAKVKLDNNIMKMLLSKDYG